MKRGKLKPDRSMINSAARQRSVDITLIGVERVNRGFISIRCVCDARAKTE